MPSSSYVPSRFSKSGVQRWKYEMMAGFGFLTLVYVVAYRVVAFSSLRPAPQYCDHQDPLECSRPDLFAFQVAGFVAQLFLASHGFMGWHGRRQVRTGDDATDAQARLFGYIPMADRLNAGILVYQLWDFVFSLAIPEHATIVFLGHHLAAAVTAYFSLRLNLCHHYALFFGGCSEISTLFLVFCDLDVYFPRDVLLQGQPSSTTGTLWRHWITLCQGAFVVTFVGYRVLGWWIVSRQLWRDAWCVRRNDGQRDDPNPDMSKTTTHGQGKSFLYLFLVMDVALGLLQLYWFSFGMLPKILELIKA